MLECQKIDSDKYVISDGDKIVVEISEEEYNEYLKTNKDYKYLEEKVHDYKAMNLKSILEIDNQEIDSAQAKAMMGLYGKQYLKEYMPAFAGIMAASAVGAHVKEQNLKEIEKKNSRNKKTSNSKEEAS